jgi:N-acetylmuramic acid 6-phosphate (MurNAc-6-P) etherase
LKSKETALLSLLNLAPSEQSNDFVHNKKQFQLHGLLTEQRHPQTWNLSTSIKKNIQEGLRQILSVDEDISESFRWRAKDTLQLNQAVEAVSRSILERRNIYVYGCGATGRLAKQMESALWRPFWRRTKNSPLWDKLKESIPEDIEDRLIGEMTGGDRALISALEGFEDLQLIGKLQLLDRGIQEGDVVFGITEGGETSSVIGTALAALEQYGRLTDEKISLAKNRLYFMYNNPDDMLKPFVRSRAVLKNQAITKINLTTGPQALAGSTRMQAATSETFIMGLIIEEGIQRALQYCLSSEELSYLGYTGHSHLEDRLSSFPTLLVALRDQLQNIAKFTELETETYKNNGRATYFAKMALITVFIDCAERSPTFHLWPLDTVQEKERKSWLQVWTEAENSREAWYHFLGREFRGLGESFYKPYFTSQISDIYLKQAALKSLAKAGHDQEKLYDFSFSNETVSTKGPAANDLGVAVCIDDEIEELSSPDSSFCRFIRLFKDRGARVALVMAGNIQEPNLENILGQLGLDGNRDVVLPIFTGHGDDFLSLNKQVVLKILLNTHSTAVMAKMGRIVGNTMTSINPSNLKLIGRATHLVLSHVNDVLSQEEWIAEYGRPISITYAEANAVLFNAMEFVSGRTGQISEVAIAIIRILESLKEHRNVEWEEALAIAESEGLESYLTRINPALRC